MPIGENNESETIAKLCVHTTTGRSILGLLNSTKAYQVENMILDVLKLKDAKMKKRYMTNSQVIRTNLISENESTYLNFSRV
jgi:hypothetical protein